MLGVVNEIPVPSELVPDDAEYQLMVPNDAVAPNPTVPVPQREAGVVVSIMGTTFIVICLLSEVVPHSPPFVSNVNVTGVPDNSPAVYVAVFGVEPPLFANEPPAPPSDHIAAEASPPNEPPKAADVPL